tara:strand:- start:121 stop:438 length:318 start_codon:yes stop_codon:yes gene_type:complete
MTNVKIETETNFYDQEWNAIDQAGMMNGIVVESTTITHPISRDQVDIEVIYNEGGENYTTAGTRIKGKITTHTFDFHLPPQKFQAWVLELKQILENQREVYKVAI